jgi:hypothetical protein
MNYTRHVSLAVWLLGVIGCSPGPSSAPSATQPLAGSVSLPQPQVATRAPTTPAISAARGGAGASGGSAGSAIPIVPIRAPGAAGSSAPAAGAASSAIPASVMCAALRLCCNALLNPRDRTLCQAIADGTNESLCKVATDDYCATAGVPSTSAATPPVPATADCPALAVCCNSLDEDDQEDCQEVVDGAVAADCRASLSELCPGTTTTPTTATIPSSGECAMLDTQCCATLDDDDDVEDCKAAVNAADAAGCQEANLALCGAGDDD